MDKSKTKDTWSRSWFIVCPNIRENGVCGLGKEGIENWTEQEICEYVVDKWGKKNKSVVCLFCRSKEGMEHLHIILCSQNAIRFSTVKKFLGDKAHIEMTQGNKKQVEDYINKTGKYEEKGEVILAKAQMGEVMGSNQGKRSDIDLIKEAIDSGMTWKAVRRLNPKFFDGRYTTMIKNLYFDKREQETPYKREVKVHWFIGESGSGKTGVTLDLVEELGEDKIYLVSDYKNGFDNYSGEPILVLDEFRGQLPYATLLGILEGYKKEIPARYSNALGLWTDVYITTVESPEQVYNKMISEADKHTDPIAQLLGRITDMNYCYKVNRVNGTKKDRDGLPCEFYRFSVTGKAYRDAGKRGNARENMKLSAMFSYKSKYYQEGDVCGAFDMK